MALFLPHRPDSSFVLFVPAKDPTAEVWHGFRWGTEGAVAEFGADVAHPLEQLEALLPDYLTGAEGICFRVGRHPKLEKLVLLLGDQLIARPAPAKRCGSSRACPILHAMRLRKDAAELDRLRRPAKSAPKPTSVSAPWCSPVKTRPRCAPTWSSTFSPVAAAASPTPRSWRAGITPASFTTPPTMPRSTMATCC